MSVITSKTGLSSILKNYTPGEREKTKNLILNKVRFQIPKEKGLTSVIDSVLNAAAPGGGGNYVAYNEYIAYVRETKFHDNDFIKTISEARRNVHKLNPKFSVLVETLLSLGWKKRSQEAINEYHEFYVDILVAHSKYTTFAINKLIATWIPSGDEVSQWKNGEPDEAKKEELENVHKLIERLLTIIPMTLDILLEAIDNQFPYYKRPSYIVGGYLYNVLWLLKYKPQAVFMKNITEMIFKKLLVADVNAPRSEIEDAEFEEDDGRDIDDCEMFPIDGCDDKDCENTMRHPVAETLDVCMEKMFEYIASYVASCNSTNCSDVTSFFKLYFMIFENVILPSHNTHHVQFLIFYLSSIKPFLAERFLNEVWLKAINPNMSAPLRQASIGYIASFLARSKCISLNTLKNYLSEMCSWAHQYIQQSDSVRTNHSLRANIVFYSICQAIFYVIAFRSKDLTSDKKSLLFLQSLQLSALVTCNLNPLRVCIPIVATAFAGVTRAYQLAYCHAILERNARRKLATVYANESSKPDESLETFFPFDPYLLKKSGKRITSIYLQYQANESDSEESSNSAVSVGTNLRRKRGDSEMDDVDDFLVDKKQKISESRNNDKELQFTYGISPGFHI